MRPLQTDLSIYSQFKFEKPPVDTMVAQKPLSVSASEQAETNQKGLTWLPRKP